MLLSKKLTLRCSFVSHVSRKDSARELLECKHLEELNIWDVDMAPELEHLRPQKLPNLRVLMLKIHSLSGPQLPALISRGTAICNFVLI